jgi:hypothetical protein
MTSGSLRPAPRLQPKSLTHPETARGFPHAKIETVGLDEIEVGRMSPEPGWRWSADVRPIVGTPSCQNRHVGVCIEGLVSQSAS